MLFDTGIVFAALDSSDAHHLAAARLIDSGVRVAIPAPTLVELDWLGGSRGVPCMDAVLSGVTEGSIRVVDLTMSDYTRMRELCGAYADLRLGFVDASVIAVAERLGEDTIATTDRRHFSVVRPRHVTSFTLVPHLPA
ncbi:MAG: PIN domain-containing protein [Thermoleophilia bacterium]|nr:PIN domain-containing protein [Thermoleophilia bacterium]